MQQRPEPAAPAVREAPEPAPLEPRAAHSAPPDRPAASLIGQLTSKVVVIVEVEFKSARSKVESILPIQIFANAQ